MVKADILADGSSNFHFRGLGDRVFAMVFRRIYRSEIEDLSVQEIEEDFKKELASARGQVARQLQPQLGSRCRDQLVETSREARRC